ncbi:type IV pilus twitching motility protein PilT [soil metagenome]
MAALDELLQYLTEKRGSDLHVKAGSPPFVRVNGNLEATTFPALPPAEIEAIATTILPAAKAAEFAKRGEIDVAHSVAGLGRFRVNVYRQRGSVGLVFRRVAVGVPALTELGLPPAAEQLSAETSGLSVVAGPAGSGKTTTVAAMLDAINRSRAAHILTIEDPIEYLHADQQSIVSQREVGTDTRGVADATRRAARQDPDVIFVGELDDVATVAEVLAAATTGHLVITTMPTTTAAETVARRVDFFPPHQHRQARHSLGSALRGIVAQRLLERSDGGGRVPAVEMLISTGKVFDAIVEGDDEMLEQLLTEGQYHGMQTFDQSLFPLHRSHQISLRDALRAAARPEDLRIAFTQAGLQAV